MNYLSMRLKGLCLPAFFAVLFVVVGCFASAPSAASIASADSGDSGKNDTAKTKFEGIQPEELTTEQSSVDSVDQIALADGKSAKKEPADIADRAPAPMLQGWAQPKLTLVLSGDIRGFLEPCGCSSRQSGGFARRGDLFEQLKAKGWPVTAFDLGGSLKRSREHDQVKFTKILSGLRQMKYSVLGLGPAELRLGADRLMSWHEPEGDSNGPGLAFVSSNIVFYDSPTQGTPLPYRIVNVDGVKVAVTSVLGDFYRDQVIPRNSKSEGQSISVVAAIPALKAAVEKMKAQKPDLMVLLSYAKVEESKDFAQQVPDFDVVLTGGGPEDPLEKPEFVGHTMVVQVGTKGKHVAVLGYYPDAKTKIRFEQLDLDKFRFKNNPNMVQLMQDFQDELKDLDLAANEQQVPHPSGATYMGAKKCGECHKKAFAKWSTTKHAHAYESLSKGRPDFKGKWVDRVNDVECIACHVTGWDPQEVVPFEGGFKSPELTPLLVGQQCENCHGPGSEHVKAELNFKKTLKATDPTLLKWRQKLHMDQTTAQSSTGCYKCHDGDNSPGFRDKYNDYFKQIQHVGKD